MRNYKLFWFFLIGFHSIKAQSPVVLSEDKWLQFSYTIKFVRNYEACNIDSVKQFGYSGITADEYIVTAFIKNVSNNVIPFTSKSDNGLIIMSNSCAGYYPVRINVPLKSSGQYPYGFLSPGNVVQASSKILTFPGQKPLLAESIHGSYEIIYFWGNVDKGITYSYSEEYERWRPSKSEPNSNIVVQGTVKNYFQNAPLIADVIVRNAVTKEVFIKTQSNKEGFYSVFLPNGAIYDMEVSASGLNTARKTYNLLNEYSYIRERFDVNICKEIDFTINLYDSELYYPMDADISISDSSGNKIRLTSNRLGTYSGKLPIQTKYKVAIKKTLYAPYEFELNLDHELMYFELVKDIDLKPKKKEVILDINDAHSKNGVAVNMRLKNMDTDEELDVDVNMIRDGKLSLNLREGNRYKIDIAGQNGYAYYNARITLDSLGESGFTTIDKEHRIYLLKLETGAQLLLKDIVFEYKSSVLKDESLDEVKRVISLLKVYPNLVIEIGAHTDDVGSEIFNLELSRKRALYVADFILSQNTSNKQLQVKGYGEAKPVVTNDTDENREKNRRLELTVISNN